MTAPLEIVRYLLATQQVDPAEVAALVAEHEPAAPARSRLGSEGDSVTITDTLTLEQVLAWQPCDAAGAVTLWRAWVGEADAIPMAVLDSPLAWVWLAVCDGRGPRMGGVKWLAKRLRLAPLRGADLHGADLHGADLRDADLSGADLCGADLYDANLRGANLCGAYLCGAYLRNANLEGAYLCGANLEGANLRGANMRFADLYGADLSGANLRGAELRSADTTGALGL